jgi:formylglycine-generating enzyme required for sulfatase activity
MHIEQWRGHALLSLALASVLLSLTLPGQAQEGSRRVPLSTPQRTALVIGNSQYSTGPLRNPVNDARDMADVLKRVGFSVTLLPDADQQQMETAVEALSQQLRQGGVGLFYFAGHGVQVAGQNYLMPVRTSITAEEDVKYKAVAAGWVLDRMEAARNTLNIMILDACREAPFTRQWRSTTQGLATMQAGTGTDTLIAFATLPGQVTADGKERNSPFTKHLLRQLVMPGVPVEEVFKRVRTAVVQETGGKQRPQDWNASTQEFRFVEGAPPQPPSPPATGPQVAVGVYPPPTPSESSKTLRNGLGMEFVLIPAGEFMMGSNNGDSDEKPVHQVRISTPFYLGQYEVTQGQWQAIMGQNPSYFKGEVTLEATVPVENVSWEDVQEFLRRLNAREGGPKYRLPTEAEWEYAARAGTSTAYSFGDSERQLGEYAWYNDNAGGKTHPVGQKKPNTWGLYDMQGNVWEWVQDWYGKDTYTSAAVTDPQGPASGSFRVYRGGGWYGTARNCRSADRFNVAPGGRYGSLGFRLLREVR